MVRLEVAQRASRKALTFCHARGNQSTTRLITSSASSSSSAAAAAAASVADSEHLALSGPAAPAEISGLVS